MGLYIHKRHKFIEHSIVNNLLLHKLEVVGIIIELNRTKYTIISIYRPPSVSASTSFEDLEKIINACGSEKVIITGDLNIDVSQQNYLSKQYIQNLT